ncbi:unnamed protein product, partial [Iphiclides podalirius]
MPKKTKVNKLARMSDEERARYLQHRADVEEEARRKKRELVARFIKGMIVTFNFLVERKDRLIASLTGALNDSDEQHRRAFQAHTENLNYFLRIGSQRLDKLQHIYDHRKDVLLENWEGEELDITNNQDRAELKLTLITYIQERDFKTYKNNKEIEMLTKKNNERLEV